MSGGPGERGDSGQGRGRAPWPRAVLAGPGLAGVVRGTGSTAVPGVIAHFHLLVPARQVPSCSPTSSCWCFAASPSSSWSSPSGSSPVRVASASGGSAPCSKVRSCPSPPAHSSTGRLPAQPLAHGTAPAHPVCPLHTHIWHIPQHLRLAQPRTRVPCTHITACIARVPCAHTHPGPCCPAHAARLTSPAHITHVPAHATHLLCIPQPCIGIRCRHYTHVPAHATRVPNVSLLQRPLRSPEHAAGACGPSGCGHAPVVLSLHLRQWVLCPRAWVLAMLRACPAVAGPHSRCTSWHTGVFPHC